MRRISIGLIVFALLGSLSCVNPRVRIFAQKWLTRAQQTVASSLKVFGGAMIEVTPQEVIRAPGQPLRIWAIGDSITEADPEHSSYRYWLWRLFENDSSKTEFVGTKWGVLGGSAAPAAMPGETFSQWHNSYFGFRADDVLPLIERAANEVSFDVALIHLGTNDLGWGEEPDQIVGDLEEIVAVLRLRNPKAIVFVAKIIPVAGNSERFVELNEELERFTHRISTVQSPVMSVDQFSGFDPEVDTYDGIHPTDEGEQKLAARWFSALTGSPGVVELLPTQ